MDALLFVSLVEEASAAPSVHNVQPARWSLREDGILLLQDLSRALPAGDPTGRDAMVSLGAACEAMCLALSRRGLVPRVEGIEARSSGNLLPMRLIRWDASVEASPPTEAPNPRSSHRTAFDAPTPADRAAALSLGSSDVAVVSGADQVSLVASMCDEASISFMRDAAFRRELVSWFRLSRRHPLWSVDGLSAEAMGMGRLEAMGAGFVLGRAFPALDAVGLVAGIVSDASVTRTASGIAVLHLPDEIGAFETGRAFMRSWLRFEAAGFRAAVLASLVDHRPSREALGDLAGVPQGRSVEGVWRIGRSSSPRPPRARLAVEDLVVRAS